MAANVTNIGEYSTLDTEDITLAETDDATDISLSPDGEQEEKTNKQDKKKRITKQLLERKQLAHDLQLLKIELSQKNLAIDNMKADNMQKVEELEEKLSDAIHQKSILQARMESQLNIQQDESFTKQERSKREMSSIMERLRLLEEKNEKLMESTGNIRKNLRGEFLIDDDKYHELKVQDEQEISLKDHICVRVYEIVNPLRRENELLKGQLDRLNDELNKCQEELDDLQEQYDKDKREYTDVQIQSQKISMELADTKGRVQHADYRVENYDKLKAERDNLEENLTEIRQRYSYLDAAHKTLLNERDDLSRDYTTTRQQVALLSQDKEYLSKNANDLQNRLLFMEEKMTQLNNGLDKSKKAREDLYENFVSTRDKYKNEYELKLQEELNNIRVRTENEIDRLKTSTREMYERENRMLRDSSELANSERDRASLSEKGAIEKYEQLMNDFRQLQISSDNKLAEVQNDLKIKSFELERTQMVYDETVRNSKENQFEIEKLSKKIEVLTKEYYNLQNLSEKRINEAEALLSEKSAKLETYEKLEEELDDVVMQAAEIEDDNEAERVLFSYGYGANVPSTAKRRLKQSVHLARRVLQLEKANTSLRKEINREKDLVKKLSDEVRNTDNLLSNAQQPYNYMIDSMKTRQKQVENQAEVIDNLRAENRKLEKELADANKTKNLMAADLERLLNHREEMSVMKNVVLNLSQRTMGESTPGKTPHKSPRSPRSPRRLKEKHLFDPSEEITHQPKATTFTKRDESNWFKKLKNKNIIDSAQHTSKVYGIRH